MVSCPAKVKEEANLRLKIEPIATMPRISSPAPQTKQSESPVWLIWIPLITYSTLVICLGLVFILSGFFRGPEAVQRIIGLMLISGSVGYLLRGRLIPNGVVRSESVAQHKEIKKETISITKKAIENNPINVPKKSIVNNQITIPKNNNVNQSMVILKNSIDSQPMVISKKNIDIKQMPISKLPIDSKPVKTEKTPAQEIDQTVLLTESSETASLEWTDTAGQKKRIAMLTSPFVIGRMPGVDFVIDNPAVGKMHAEIHMNKHTEQSIRLFDLNSRNGSFVNDAPVDIHKGAAIKDGDRLRFANNDYVFIYKKLTTVV